MAQKERKFRPAEFYFFFFKSMIFEALLNKNVADRPVHKKLNTAEIKQETSEEAHRSPSFAGVATGVTNGPFPPLLFNQLIFK